MHAYYLQSQQLASVLPGAELGGKDVPALLLKYLPWERRRLERLLAFAAATELDELRAVERDLRNHLSLPVALAARAPWTRLQQEWETSLPIVGRVFSSLQSHLRAFHQTQRRATVVRLELQCWRVVQGRFPERLRELQSGDVATDIRDPCSGLPFVYRPQGFGLELSSPGGRDSIRPFQPFLWSTGLHIAPAGGLGESESSRVYYRYPAGPSGHVLIATQQELFQSGWCFKIPVAGE
jgi:hypothetical protein